jgi:hypothetical protein
MKYSYFIVLLASSMAFAQDINSIPGGLTQQGAPEQSIIPRDTIETAPNPDVGGDSGGEAGGGQSNVDDDKKVNQDSVRIARKSQCRVLYPGGAIHFSLSQNGISNDMFAVGSLLVNCPVGQSFRILPLVNGIPSEIIPAVITAGNGQKHDAQIVLGDERGRPMAYQIFKGSGEEQEITITARLISDSHGGAVTIEIPTYLQILME